ncbi:MAG: glycosyltransferase family 4 protein [Salinivirgaceae bacterium]|nr:glycosyltransferase family 4 protein [Salinivirgaceae bacterium]
MRILHIIPRLNKGGAERLCLDICNQLQKRDGVQVRLITFSDENHYPFLAENLDWQVIPVSVQLSIFHQNVLSIDALQKAIEDFAPDVIHTHLFEAEIVSRSCQYPQAKWFSHCHDNMRQFRNFGIKTLFNKQLLTNFFEKRYLFSRYKANGGNTFIAISHDTEQYFRKTARKYNVQFLPNSIDYEKFHRDNSRQPSTKLRLVNVGSYQAKKNQSFLVEVAKILRKRYIDFEMNLLGDGGKFGEVANLIKENHLEANVMQRGNVENVAEYLWQSDIYVHSAYYEPFGLVLAEAMAAGLPVVTLDGRGNRDLIVQGKNGYMVYEQDAEQFADRILEIWNNKQKYQEMSGFAQEFARQYDIKPYVDRLLELYKTN